MCEALHSNYDIFAKLNHKSITAEHSQRILYKSVVIAAEERGTNDSFVPAGVPFGYAWNSAPQYSSYLSRTSVSSPRQSQYFSKTNAKQRSSCIRLFKTHRLFSSFFHFYRKILIEDRRTVHAKRIKNNRNLVTLKPGNTIMAITATQSNKKKDKVVKMCFIVRGPY